MQKKSPLGELTTLTRHPSRLRRGNPLPCFPPLDACGVSILCAFGASISSPQISSRGYAHATDAIHWLYGERNVGIDIPPVTDEMKTTKTKSSARQYRLQNRSTFTPIITLPLLPDCSFISTTWKSITYQILLQRLQQTTKIYTLHRRRQVWRNLHSLFK